MITIRNRNEKYGDPETSTGNTLDEAVATMQATIRDCGPEFAAVVVGPEDYEVVWQPTHRIIFEPLAGEPQVWECMEDDGSVLETGFYRAQLDD